jgi:hypothetical protein
METQIIRPHSRKARALAAAMGQSLDAVIRHYASTTLTYQEIADCWTREVQARFPDQGYRWGISDVHRYFKANGVLSTAIEPGRSGAKSE